MRLISSGSTCKCSQKEQRHAKKDRFQCLVDELLEEHELMIDRLNQENSRLEAHLESVRDLRGTGRASDEKDCFLPKDGCALFVRVYSAGGSVKHQVLHGCCRVLARVDAQELFTPWSSISQEPLVDVSLDEEQTVFSETFKVDFSGSGAVLEFSKVSTWCQAIDLELFVEGQEGSAGKGRLRIGKGRQLLRLPSGGFLEAEARFSSSSGATNSSDSNDQCRYAKIPVAASEQSVGSMDIKRAEDGALKSSASNDQCWDVKKAEPEKALETVDAKNAFPRQLSAGSMPEEEAEDGEEIHHNGGLETLPTYQQEKAKMLQKLFRVQSPEAKVVIASELAAVLSKQTHHAVAASDMHIAILQLRGIHAKLSVTKARHRRDAIWDHGAVIAWAAFQSLMLIPDLASHADPEMSVLIFNLQHALLSGPSNASRLSAFQFASESIAVRPSWPRIYLQVLDLVVMISVCTSVLSLGMSVDNDPEALGWLVLEGCLALIFLAEIISKVVVSSPRVYFLGPGRHWNWLDSLVTTFAISDVMLSASDYISTSDNLAAKLSENSQTGMILRTLRVARFARMVRLRKIPLLRELSSMLSGLLISMPWLFWVFLLLIAVIYVCAIIARTAVTFMVLQQPNLDACGPADNYSLDDPSAPEGCKLHLLYGIEYCSSMWVCMLTIFRCICGDCTTRLGRQLAPIFFQGFGATFELTYTFGMVMVIFGLFNVITAIFVDATVSGLKYNETQRKYAKLSESSYLNEKLSQLVQEIANRARHFRRERLRRTPLMHDLRYRNNGNIDDSVEEDGSEDTSIAFKDELMLTETEFISIMMSSEVRALLDDMNISMEPRGGIFEAFDQSGDGQLTMTEIVSGLMRLRGEMQKNDIVAAQLAIASLQKRVGDLQTSIISSQSRMTTMLSEVLAQTKATAHSVARQVTSMSSDDDDLE
eukprot:TRINITY_DN11127_c1_g1_i1.p1 TRINITY_DN11127_c1_g1~~TRINITY_DN11127_c1_g1_i1.p1  ORF type:complete len:951 (+),score=187.09 TRINITY_DN11127_c1_g1_i1:54-2855(+)